MSAMEYIHVLSSGTIAFLTYLYTVTLILVGLWVWGLAATGRSLKDRPMRLTGLCLLPFILTLAVSTIGVVFRDGGPMPGGTFAAGLIYVLVLAHFPLGVFVSARSGPQWPVVAASSALWSWITCCTAFVAGMSVTGDWL